MTHKKLSRKDRKNMRERERLRLKKEREEQELQDRLEESLDETEVPIEEPQDEEQDSEVEDMGKSMGEYPMPVPVPAPTSFDELDELEAAREKDHEVAEVTWAVRDLVSNILYDPELDPTEKADRIMDVADEYATRVEQALQEDDDEMKKDMDVLQIEALLATDARHTSLIERGTDLIKRKLSYKARKRLGDSDFALPSKRKYPIHDKAHVRNALSRAAQQIKRGGQAAADAKAALPKIRAAAKRMGIGMEKSAFLIEKDKNDDWRWIGKPSNNFIDSQNDIICKTAHQKYVAWIDNNPDMYPVFMTWHTPGTARTHPADFAMEHEGALIMSGKLTESEAAALLKAQTVTDLGMSLQGLGLRLDVNDPRVITDYWLYEVSDLPLEKAANPFTSLETISKEAGMDKLQYLTEMMGSEEKAKAFLERTGQMQKQLQEAGITSKADTDQVAPPPAEPAQPAPAPAPAMDVKQLTAEIVKAVGKEYDMDGLSETLAKVLEAAEKVTLLEEVVRELQKSKEQSLAEVLTPPVAKFSWTLANRPSASPENKISKDKDDNLANAQPGVPNDYWLSHATHTNPILEPAGG